MDLLSTVVTAAGVFLGTNVDDSIVVTVLFLSARTTGTPKAWQVWAGQYAGVAALVAISAVAALGLAVVPDDRVGLLGLVPLALGVRGLVGAWRARRGPDEVGVPAVAGGLAAIVGVTIANGADNISIYTPLFRSIGVVDSVITVAVFAVLVAVWCLAGSWLGSRRRVIAVVEHYGRWIVPAVFVVIGAAILVESGVS